MKGPTSAIENSSVPELPRLGLVQGQPAQFTIKAAFGYQLSIIVTTGGFAAQQPILEQTHNCTSQWSCAINGVEALIHYLMALSMSVSIPSQAASSATSSIQSSSCMS
eukprot:6200422-Amphidinium_carterae.1